MAQESVNAQRGLFCECSGPHTPRCRALSWSFRQTAPSPALGNRARNILGRLQRGPATGWELIQAGGGTRYSARIMELRRRGHQIEAKQQREGVWLYTLVVPVD